MCVRASASEARASVHWASSSCPTASRGASDLLKSSLRSPSLPRNERETAASLAQARSDPKVLETQELFIIAAWLLDPSYRTPYSFREVSELDIAALAGFWLLGSSESHLFYSPEAPGKLGRRTCSHLRRRCFRSGRLFCWSR